MNPVIRQQYDDNGTYVPFRERNLSGIPEALQDCSAVENAFQIGWSYTHTVLKDGTDPTDVLNYLEDTFGTSWRIKEQKRTTRERFYGQKYVVFEQY